MQAVTPLKRGQLAAKYADPDWRRKFLDLLSITQLLSGSIIESKFRVPDSLNQAIALSEAGRRVRDQLVKKEEVNAKDANVLCLLVLVHIEPLIDVDHIDVDRLIEVMSELVRTEQLRFPFIFGRDLYQRAVGLFKEERRELRHEDTLKLLSGVPQGVWHAGRLLVGPFGVLPQTHEREMFPDHSIPLQHCADISCPAVHEVSLTTSQEPGVNRERSHIYKVLDQISADPSEWNGFLSDLLEAKYNPYDENDYSTLPYLLGDGFNDDELTELTTYALRQTEGRLAAVIASVGGKNSPAWLKTLNRAQLLQLLLTETDESLAALLDSALAASVLDVSTGEIRRPMVNHRNRSGAWRLRSEFSSLGYRAVSTNPSLALLRLSSLARALFDVNNADDMDDLAWLLRDVRGETAEGKLEEFLRSSEPAAILQTLAMSHRRSAERASRMLGLSAAELNDTHIDVMLWKLGFPPRRREDIRDRYWIEHDRLEGLSKTAEVLVGREEGRLREVSSNYFVALEEFLFDSLVFATWALLTDHVAAERPFQFQESTARSFTIARLNASADGPAERRNDLSDGPSLGVLVQGFSRLSKLLSALRAERDTHLRGDEELPKFVSKTKLQRFPFMHTAPYLDLTASAQLSISEALANVAAELNDSGVLTARNGLLHASRNRVPTVAEVGDALRRARAALGKLEEIGCVRTTYKVTQVESDSWGRSITTVTESSGRSVRLSSPSSFEMLRLPSLHRPFYLIQGAIFSPPDQMLRFREGFESSFEEYWQSFPTRPEPGNRAIASQTESVSDLVAPRL